MRPTPPRRIRFLHLWEPPGWRIKVYGIACAVEEPAAELVSAAKEVALERVHDRIGGQFSEHRARAL